MSDVIVQQEDFAQPSWDDLFAAMPHNTQAEQAILCAILKWPDSISRIINLIKPDFFYHETHKAIYEACLLCYKTQVPIEPVAVVSNLDDLGLLFTAGGASYVNDLFINSPSDISFRPESLEHWAKLIADCAQRAEVIKTFYQLASMSQDKTEKAFLEKAQSQLMTIAQSFSQETSGSTDKMIDDAMALIEGKLIAPNGLTGLSTGFKALDAKTHGFQNGNLIILGARPSTGKTTLALNIAAHAVLQEKKPVLFFSLEMSGQELLEDVIKLVAGSTCNLGKLKQAVETVKAHQNLLHIKDKPDISLMDIQGITQKTQALCPDLGLVIIDHLGLVKPEEAKRFQNRAYELEEISWGLKAMAKTLKLPVLLLCQLNRAIETRQDKKPMLSDLRDSGAIEQNADIVMFLSGEREEPKRLLTIAKHRNGPLGEIPLSFHGAMAQFKEFHNQF